MTAACLSEPLELEIKDAAGSAAPSGALESQAHKWLEAAARRVETQTGRNVFILTPWRIITNAVENFFENDDLLRASALTYTSALSIVPILALAFSALKGLGAQDQLRPLVARYLALGSEATSDE